VSEQENGERLIRIGEAKSLAVLLQNAQGIALQKRLNLFRIAFI
jgi:hypothetical protein